HRGAGPPPLCRRRPGGGALPPAAGQPEGTRPRWRRRGASGRPRVWRAPGGPAALDLAPVERYADRRWLHRYRLARDGASTVKKNELKPWLKKCWCIPPEQNAEFVWHMEDVLAVYQRPYDPKRPQLCLDEASKQLLGE